MDRSNGSIGTEIDTRALPPQEIEVDAENRKVMGACKALRDTGTVKVRDEEGVVLFYCVSVAEYRRLKAADAAGE